jgi:hypothetical protein
MVQKKGIWLIVAAVILMGGVSIFLFYLNRNTIVMASWGNETGTRNSLADWFNVVQQGLVTPAIASILGALIVRRHPRHRVGWLLIVISLVNSLMLVISEWAVYGNFTVASTMPGAAVAAWITNWAWIILFAMLLYLAAVFPTGQFISGGWRQLVLVMLVWFTLPLVFAAVIESPMTSAFQITNPLGIDYPPALHNVLFYLGLPAMPVTALTLLASAIVRYRRGQGREQQQMKWLLAGVMLTAFLVVSGLVLSLLADNVLGDILVNTSILGPMLGMGVALLRHRLYDIDIIIRRTLIYALLSGLLVLVYFSTVVVLQSVVTVIGGQQSGVVVVISTLVIAALFNPVRQQTQTLVDRRFYRSKYNAALTLARFSQIARDEVELDRLTAELLQVSAKTMQPSHISFWLKPDLEK